VPLQRGDQAVGGVGGAERQVRFVGVQPRPLDQAEGAEHRHRDQAPVGQAGELDQPGRVERAAVAVGLAAAGAATAQAAGGLHGEPGLAHPAGTGEGDQPVPAEQLHHLRELLLPPDEAGERPRQVAPAPPGRGRGGHRLGGHRRRSEGGILGEDRFFDPPQLHAGVQAGLLGEPPADPLVGGQRIGLPAGRVQRPHEQGVQPLPQGMLRGQRLQLANQPGVLAKRQLRFDAVLQRSEAQLLQEGGAGGGERLCGELGQRLATPKPERLAQRRGGLDVPTGGKGLMAITAEALEAERVHLVGLHRQQVAGWPGGEPLAA
jgi:hypothetical protein